MFVHVLKNPTLPSANSDISLMDVIVGHFGYLEYASESELVFPFPREIVSHARVVVKRAREGLSTSQSSQNPQSKSDADAEQSEPFSNYPLPEVSVVFPRDFSCQTVMVLTLTVQFMCSDTADFGLEDWPSFLPSFSGVSSMMLNGASGFRDMESLL